MTNCLVAVETIPLWRLALGLLPCVAVLWVLWRWSLGPWKATYAIARMLVQLALVGYVLTFLFESDSPGLVLLALTVMLGVSSWIALRTIAHRSWAQLRRALTAISIAGGASLFLVTQGVLAVSPWYEPKTVIPLAGMVFASAMNAVSLAAERYEAQLAAGDAWSESRRTALNAGMIPTVNALLAVGLVSLPGMMTGQVLSGVDPLIAARYQVMIMAMLFGVSGGAAALYLAMQPPVQPQPPVPPQPQGQSRPPDGAPG